MFYRNGKETNSEHCVIGKKTVLLIHSPADFIMLLQVEVVCTDGIFDLNLFRQQKVDL